MNFFVKIVVMALVMSEKARAEDELFLQNSEETEADAIQIDDQPEFYANATIINDNQDLDLQNAEEKNSTELVCTPGCKTALGASGAATAIGAIFAIPMVMGFGASGVVAGSTAAGM